MSHKRTRIARDDLASRLRELRLQRRASLVKVAVAIGTSGQHLSAIETGRIENPGYKTVLALAKYYQVPLARLIDYTHGSAHPSLSFDEAIQLLRDKASPQGRAAIVVVTQQLLALGWCMPDPPPNDQ